MRQSTELALQPGRLLTKKFNQAGTGAAANPATDTAIPINAPSTFGGKEVAMGISGKEGILSFIHDGADQSITVWEYSQKWEKVNPASKGWYRFAETDALATKTVNGNSKASVKISESVLYFLQAATSPCTNCMVSGSEYPKNPNTDISKD